MNPAIKNPTKWWLILGIAAAAGILHYGGNQDVHGLHMIHREIFFLPIILAGFWFGVLRGLLVSISVSIVYASYFYIRPDMQMNGNAIGLQIVMFFLIAVVLGYLSDRRKNQQQALMETYGLSVLGRAAAIVGYEMKELSNSLERLSGPFKEKVPGEMADQFDQELAQLGKMVDVITSFAPEDKSLAISQDLNEMIASPVVEFEKLAQKKRVVLNVHEDPDGCPVVTSAEQMQWVVAKLLKNALDYSKPGNVIHLTTVRGGNNCYLSITGQGPGIKKENLPKMFSPFFTTRKGGRGLTLAACRKVVRSLGGDITVDSRINEGATFTILVPRNRDVRDIRQEAMQKSKTQNQSIIGLGSPDSGGRAEAI